jgi:hypothetical protein
MDWEDPFPGSWAVQAKLLTRWQLSKDFTRIHPDVYVRKGFEQLSARRRAIAAGHWAKGGAVLVGYSAAAMHGVHWFDDKPAELAGRCRSPGGILARQTHPGADEIEEKGGFRVTTPARTAFDLGCRLEVEYDGAHHWTDPSQRTHDIDRYALLDALGWSIVRVGNDLLDRRPWLVTSRVRAALLAHGAPME